MRIAQIMLNRGHGGVQRHFLDSCRELGARGHEVHALVDARERAQFSGVDGFHCHPIRFPTRRNPLAARAIGRVLREVRAEVGHIHARRALALAVPAARQLGIPTAATLHSFGNARPYAAASRMVGLTEGHARHIRAQLGAEAAVTVVPNFCCLPQTEGRALPLSGPLKFLAYGRYVHKKGFDVLIDAMQQGATELEDCQLTLVGDGPDRGALEQRIAAAGLGARIRLTGWQPDILELVDAHDVVVVPSRSEPFGIVLLEAMARGRPLISTRTEGPGEYLSPAVALMCEPGDVDGLAECLTIAANDRAGLRDRAAAALTLFRDNYTPAAVIPRLEALYEGLLRASSDTR